MDTLPNELIELILCKLDARDLASVERVCQRLSGLVISRYWQRDLILSAKEDFFLAKRLHELGWNPDESGNKQVLRQCHLKWRLCQVTPTRPGYVPQVDSVTMKYWTPTSFLQEKPAEFVAYMDKLYIGLKSTRIEVWSLEPEIKFCHALNDPEVDLEENGLNEHVLRHCSLSLHENILVAIDSSSENVLAWDLDTEAQVLKLRTPKGKKMYDVRINNSHIIGLSGWGLLIWERQGPEGVKDSIPLYKPDFVHQMDFTDFMSCHKLDLNDRFVVTLGTWRRDDPASVLSVSKVHIRDLKDPSNKQEFNVAKFEHLKKLFDESLEVTETCLSNKDGTLLALLVTDVQREARTLLYSIYIVDLARDTCVHLLSHNSPILADIRIPVQWLGTDRLFYKLVPRPGQDCEHVTLGKYE